MLSAVLSFAERFVFGRAAHMEGGRIHQGLLHPAQHVFQPAVRQQGRLHQIQPSEPQHTGRPQLQLDSARLSGAQGERHKGVRLLQLVGRVLPRLVFAGNPRVLHIVRDCDVQPRRAPVHRDDVLLHFPDLQQKAHAGHREAAAADNQVDEDSEAEDNFHHRHRRHQLGAHHRFRHHELQR